jgi:hypothetical protein
MIFICHMSYVMSYVICHTSYVIWSNCLTQGGESVTVITRVASEAGAQAGGVVALASAPALVTVVCV